MNPRLVRALSGLVLAALAAATPVRGDAVDAALERLAASAGQRAPLMRIGLENGHSVTLSSRGAFRIVDPSSGKAVWRESFSGTIQCVAEGGPEGEVPELYRIQVGAFGDRAAAEAELERLAGLSGTEGVVRHDPDRGNWRVRLGSARDRLALNPLMEQLRAGGIEAPWIVTEPAEELDGVRMRLVDASYDSLPLELDRVALIPLDGRHVEVGGKSYRGVIELRLTSFGTVRAINWVNLERYLLGVVPAELGPEVWPQLEALRAQAVAARTYAWRNRGQFSDDGYDLCATPRCQVYAGARAEHPLSDRAVESTAGEVLTWQGRPIVALYTATCGGHTENGRDIFPEDDHPYLTGVPCHAEGDAMATLRGTLTGRRNPPIVDETGEPASRAWSLLRVSGVIAADAAAPADAARPIDGETLRRWTARLSRLAGLEPPHGPVPSPSSLGETALALVEDLGWSERAGVLLSAEDLPALLRDPRADRLPEDQRRALAYLLWNESLRPFPDGRLQVKRQPSRARTARVIARAAEIYDAFDLAEGTISGVGKDSLRIVRGKGEIRIPLADKPELFGRTGGKPVPVARLELWPGDRVRYRTDSAGRIGFLELRAPVKGASDDRSSAVYSWEVRRSRRELEADVNARVSVGRLVDLVVKRRGVSGRVVELEVVGTSGSTVVRGFDVRRLLDLREILTVIEIQRDGQGQISAVVFTGKGWGHGVGLCQVGAYGMALRGATYKDILGHYYRGAGLERAVAGGD